MATPKTLTILVLFLGVISACPDGERRQLFFRADFTFGNRRLMKHVIESIKVRDFDMCELHCYHQPSCVSINFNVIPDSNVHECELNNATHRSHDNELENIGGYIYKGAESACDERRCKNGGTCQSGYTDKGYRCLCPPQWTSPHCGEDVNECEKELTNQCHKDAICSNTEGSYSCNCKEGFVGDGFTCSCPNGTGDGSYLFKGSQHSSITFSDSNSKLDIGVSITILCWLYTYRINTAMKFLDYKGMKLFVNHKKLILTFHELSRSNSRGQFLTGTLAEKGWTFVGVSYNGTTAEAKLWIDGNMVNSGNITAHFVSTDYQLLTLGGQNFEGKITQLMLFNLTLTQDQIQGIKGRMKLPVMIFNSTIISNNSFYSAELASFLAPVVGQIISKWKLCYNALANKWDLQIFHTNCDDKKHTVTIIKKDAYIFGGYTDIPWGGTSGGTPKAFIFSLENKKALPPFICLPKNSQNAINKGEDLGPSFGNQLFITTPKRESMARIPDSYIVPTEVNLDNAWRRKILAGEAGTFSPYNYEVFYLGINP
ncbi:uncharacterized protein [Acropora muricata]|uniref:uncharacterized protein isoform X2 n=1 Tax=Acropora muricata TaxID=159855 RepID=UPI0034E5030E